MGIPDKLTMLLALDDQRLSPDLGTPGYGIGLNDTWYRHTLSHNTVLLDQTAQPPGRGELRCFRAPEGRGLSALPMPPSRGVSRVSMATLGCVAYSWSGKATFSTSSSWSARRRETLTGCITIAAC